MKICEYKKSRYFADFQKKYAPDVFYSPQYRFYDSAMKRNIGIKYVRQESNGFEYFIRDGVIFLFPDFLQLGFLNDDNGTWQVLCGGKKEPKKQSFEERFSELLSKLENPSDYPVKVLVERRMIPVCNLNDAEIPDNVFVTWSFENAFENDDSPLKQILPQSSKELYDMMIQTPDLCGKFELVDDGYIVWDLFENVWIQMDVSPQDGYLGFIESAHGKSGKEIFHMHPDMFEIYEQVCDVGTRGNVTVLRTSFVSAEMLYAGRKDMCPYSPNKKFLLHKFYYLEAR